MGHLLAAAATAALVAATLARRGIPFAFATGHDVEGLEWEYATPNYSPNRIARTRSKRC